jgi:glycosyltransferase involved in cell wall biosynthesis
MILDIGIDELNVLYLETGYDEEVFSGIEKIEKRNDNKVKFIFGGSLSIAGQSKGLEKIILSLDNLIKLGDVKNCTFSIYCSNQYEKEELLDFINKNNIQKDIKIYDRVNSNEFLRELLNSDIGVIPLPDSNHVNKFSSSMKYFEYIRADLVIVCSNVEANKRFNYPKSIFYNNESEEIALAIKSSLELLSSGVAFDKKNIQEYSIQNRVYKIVKKINEI